MAKKNYLNFITEVKEEVFDIPLSAKTSIIASCPCLEQEKKAIYLKITSFFPKMFSVINLLINKQPNSFFLADIKRRKSIAIHVAGLN